MDERETTDRRHEGGTSPWTGADERELRDRAAAREERTRPAWIAWLDSREAAASAASSD